MAAENSYIIVLVDSHGRDIPELPYRSNGYKIAVIGESGNNTPLDVATSHAIYSTCAEYNSRGRYGEEAATGLSAKLKSSVLPYRQKTRTVTKLAKYCKCSEEDIFKVSVPSFDKLFSFVGEQTWEKEHFGIFIVGHDDSNHGIKGVNHYPPQNIKDGVFARTTRERDKSIRSRIHVHNEILLSVLMADLKKHYNVETVIVIDYTCRYLHNHHDTAIARTLSAPNRVTHEPMSHSDNPTPRPAVGICPHPCRYCDSSYASSLDAPSPQASFGSRSFLIQPSQQAPSQSPFGATLPGFGATPHGFGATPPGFGATPPGFGATLPGFGAQSAPQGPRQSPFGAQSIRKFEETQSQNPIFRKGGHQSENYKRNSKKRKNKKYISRKNKKYISRKNKQI